MPFGFPPDSAFTFTGIPISLWLTDDRDESAVFSGVVRWVGSKLVLDRSPKPQFEIRSEWHERIQPVANGEARKILLGADYFLRPYVGRLPDGSALTDYLQTGLKWPEG
jgi:hypothetical protein